MQAALNRLLTVLCGLAMAVVAFAAAHAADLLAPAPMPPGEPRLRIFISDVHLGVGRMAQDAAGDWTVGPWHPMEDFRWHDEFDLFLADLETRGKKAKLPVDLIIVGDFLELWQTPTAQMDCSYDSNGNVLPPDEAYSPKAVRDLSCTEADALRRAERVIGAHRPTLNRLRAFAGQGDNRVVIIPGNHDAALAFDQVAKLLLKTIGAPDDRVSIARQGYWLSADGLIYAEHGHFVPGDVNDFRSFPAACLDLSATNIVPCNQAGTTAFLQRPWGEAFVQKYYNLYEEQFPIIDNITSELYGAKLAVKASGSIETLQAFVRGFKFLIFGESLSQFGRLLGDPNRMGSPDMLGAPGPQPRWDIAATKQKPDRFLVESLADDDPVRALAEQALAGGQLGFGMADLTPDEVNELCDRRAARRELAKVANGAYEAIELCPGGKQLGAILTSLVQSSVQRKATRLEQVWKALPPGQRPTRDFAVYVYAHTHAAHAACRPRSMVTAPLAASDGPPAAWDPAVINTGAWQRLITPAKLAELLARPDAKPLKDYRPEDLPACYPVVAIPDYDLSRGQRPAPRLFFWAKDPAGGAWRLLPSCPGDPDRLPVNACGD
jgi:UDP-2,3-diacylglucosamine pyrophosphatase LpxH